MSDEHPVYYEHRGYTYIRFKDATENRDLRELVEDFREAEQDVFNNVELRQAYADCANMLEQVIDDE